MKKAPKIFSYALWGVVLFRLICPFSFESIFSFMPTSSSAIPHDIVYSQNPTIQTGIQFVDTPINTAISNSFPSVSPANSINPINAFLEIAGYVWLLGFIALLFYATIGYIRLKQRVYYATLVRDNIYETDKIRTPFVLGFIRPKIYIPLGIEPSQYDYIVKHEQTHIKRRDYLIKPFAFIIFALHWFNPLMWAAYLLMSKDMEMSCDEAVLRKANEDIRGVYSSSLLNLSANRVSLLSPLAFGESDVKSRIKNVLSFKKPAIWLTVVCLLVVSVFLVGFASNKVDLAISINVHNGDLQPMVFVDSTLYRISTKNTSYSQTNDEFMYLGEITSTTNTTTPNKDFQANDSIIGAKVYQYYENIVVLINEKYYLYEKVTRNMTLDDVRSLAAKGDLLTVTDFDLYHAEPTDEESAYAPKFIVDDGSYILYIFGSHVYDNVDFQIILMRADDIGNDTGGIDIRYYDVDKYVRDGTRELVRANESPAAINIPITNDVVLSTYITDDGLSRVVLRENNRFIVEGRPEISYNPTGSYEIDGNKLYLNVSENQQFIFSIYENSLVFESGEWLENWIAKETVFTLLEDEQ